MESMLIIGCGYMGQRVIARLADPAQATGLVRSDANAAAIRALGARVLLGDLDGADLPPLPSRDPTRPPNAHLFFVFYFLMTGLHGLHVLAGMAVIAWLLGRAIAGHFGADYFTPVDLGGLYWHVVDLIWIFLFPLFYLIG